MRDNKRGTIEDPAVRLDAPVEGHSLEAVEPQQLYTIFVELDKACVDWSNGIELDVREALSWLILPEDTLRVERLK